MFTLTSLSLLALTAWSFPTAVASTPQAPTPFRALFQEGDTVIHQGIPWTVEILGSPVADPGGGWMARVSARNTSAVSGLVRFLIGAPLGTPIDDVTVIAGPVVSGFQVATAIIDGSSVDGHFGLVTESSGVYSATLDGITVLQTGDQIAGTDWTVKEIERIYATATPSLAYAVGFVENPQGDRRRAHFRVPSAEIVLLENEFVPNYAQPIETLSQNLMSTRSGAHWWTRVTFRQSGVGLPLEGIVMDGEAFDLGNGSLLIAREPLPSYVAPPSSGLDWNFGMTFLTTDSNHWVVRGSSTGLGPINIRNSRNVFEPGLQPSVSPFAMDMDGMILVQQSNDALVESAPFLNRPAPVDIDGDGLGDAEYVWDAGRSFNFAGSNDARIPIFFTRIERPGPGLRTVILAGPDYRLGEPLCSGVPNSTGRASGVGASGRSMVDENWLTLQSWDLPEGAFGYFMVSKTAGFTAQPGGSMGNLCLGGPIGRVVDQVFSVGRAGRANASLDLQALPQPMGSVLVQPGETWHAQAWHRDTVGGMSTSNFTAAISIEFD